jgi:hypothetical protein
MNSIKCKNCGLSNFASETECRRCGNSFSQSSQVDKLPRRFSFATLAILAVVAGLLYYVFLEMQQSVSEVNANDANRVASQAKDPAAGLSRTEYDRQRAGQYGNAMQNNPSFAAKKKRDEETQKIILQASNSSQP